MIKTHTFQTIYEPLTRIPSCVNSIQYKF